MNLSGINFQNKIRFSSTFEERENALKNTLGEIPDVRYQVLESQTDSVHISSVGTIPSVKLTRRAVVWDSEKAGFVYRHEAFQQYQHSGSHKRNVIASAEVPLGANLMDEKGIFVDMDNKRLIFPDGRWIDGPTGKLHTIQGVEFSQFQAQNSKEI
jgi:hypothetical protein